MKLRVFKEWHISINFLFLPIEQFRYALVNSAVFGYNPFTMTNNNEIKVSAVFDLLSQPARIQILMVISEQPACVCHLEAALGLRQASISQHLMMLRKSGLVKTQREGRNIYYSLTNPRLINLIEEAANLSCAELDRLKQLAHRPLEDCPCPQCHPDLPPEYSCKSLRKKSDK